MRGTQPKRDIVEIFTKVTRPVRVLKILRKKFLLLKILSMGFILVLGFLTMRIANAVQGIALSSIIFVPFGQIL